MVVHFASSARSTRAGVTWIRPLDTSLALANVSGVAVVVYDTLGAAAGDRVWFGNQSGLTFANGIVIRAHPARGPGSTG